MYIRRDVDVCNADEDHSCSPYRKSIRPSQMNFICQGLSLGDLIFLVRLYDRLPTFSCCRQEKEEEEEKEDVLTLGMFTTARYFFLSGLNQPIAVV